MRIISFYLRVRERKKNEINNLGRIWLEKMRLYTRLCYLEIVKKKKKTKIFRLRIAVPISQ